MIPPARIHGDGARAETGADQGGGVAHGGPQRRRRVDRGVCGWFCGEVGEAPPAAGQPQGSPAGHPDGVPASVVHLLQPAAHGGADRLIGVGRGQGPRVRQRHGRLEADERGRQQVGAQVHPVEDVGALVQGADHPVQPADPRAAARVGVLDLLHGVEVAAVGGRQPHRVDRGQPVLPPHPGQRRERRVQTEGVVGVDQLPLLEGDERAGAVVGLLAVGHDHRQPVRPAALGEHHEDVAPSFGTEDGRGQYVTDHARGDPCPRDRARSAQEGASRELVVRAAAVGLSGHRWSPSGELRTMPRISR